MTESARKSSPAGPSGSIRICGWSMTHLPSGLPAKDKAHTAEPVSAGGGQNAALQPCEQFLASTILRRCGVHRYPDASLCRCLIILSSYLMACITQEPCPDSIHHRNWGI